MLQLASREGAEPGPAASSGDADKTVVHEPARAQADPGERPSGAGAPGQAGVEAQPVRPEVPGADASAPVVSVPPGFYAIAASSQRAGGVHELSEDLEADGYTTQVVPRQDEANEIWYRLMVGPYATRAEAGDILLRLRRERGIQGWVREVPQEGQGLGNGDEL